MFGFIAVARESLIPVVDEVFPQIILTGGH